MKERDILVWLNGLAGINNRYMERLDSLEDLDRIWEMSCEEINGIEGIGDKLKKSIITGRDKSEYERTVGRARDQGIKIITIRDPAYPERLKCIPDPPRVLYVKGELKTEDRYSISIVGPRKASSYGLWVAEMLSKELSNLGITVVSGMALGVDAAAHMAALESGGRTLAVLGTGVDVVYPSRNRHIYERITENGAVISEFPLGTEGLPYRFPQRNRIISGLSLGTIVIEAGEKSGTLTTVQHGLDQGKEIFAVPGNINSAYSRGTNLLIQDGAKLVQNIDDVLLEISELREILESVKKEKKNEKLEGLGESEKKMMDILSVEPMSVERITTELDEPVSRVMGMLTVLEIKGKLKKGRDGFYFRV